MSRQHQRHIVGIHYALGSKIGEGSFGVIFEGENILNDHQRDPVAIKFEPRNSDAPQLRDEFRAYRILNDSEGIPHAYYYGQEGMHNVLVIDLLGPSLEDLFEWCGRKFSVKTTCLIAKQMIRRIREIHERDLIYRDIKPDNFLISQFQLMGHKSKYTTKSAHGDPNLIYMVDFGMAKQYRDPRSKQHIPYRERKSLSGTARYMSINTHFGREQSRRDDLESLGHVFFYFLRGSLPWQGLKAPNNKLKYEKIGLTKQKLNPSDLLMNNSLPSEFATYLKYVRALKFEEEPDYDYLIQLMDDVLEGQNLQDDNHYDWMDLNNGKGWDITINKRANLHGYGNPAPRHGANDKAPNKKSAQPPITNNNHTANRNTDESNNYSQGNVASSANDVYNSSGRLQSSSQRQAPQRYIKSSSKTYNSMGKLNGNSTDNSRGPRYIPQGKNNDLNPNYQQQQNQSRFNSDNYANYQESGSGNSRTGGICSKIFCCSWC